MQFDDDWDAILVCWIIDYLVVLFFANFNIEIPKALYFFHKRLIRGNYLDANKYILSLDETRILGF